MNSSILRLGTRKSALAWAQSSWVARTLERLNPSIHVELVGIETRGDRIQDVPLSQVEGKEFFTAEIDQALLQGRVDLTVHSLKDLSLERPAGLSLASIPKRENPRDVLVASRDLMDRIQKDLPIRIGTSSPRRLENLPSFLKQALPGGEVARFEWCEIRGNVDTRLGRLQESSDPSRKLEGVILALAGLNRLFQDSSAGGGRSRLEKLLNDVRWMVLPLSENPTAPGQGALAIECRAEDLDSRAKIQKLEDAATRVSIERERELLHQWGGGCHQRFGATSIDHPRLGTLFFIRGKKPDGTSVEETRWLSLKSLPPAPKNPVIWDGSFERSKQDLQPQSEVLQGIHWPVIRPGQAVFIAHSRALPPGEEHRLQSCRVWTSGVASWKRLASRGVWVEGCSENLGFEAWFDSIQGSALSLPTDRSGWLVLTHDQAHEGWQEAQIVKTYHVTESVGDSSRQALPQGVTHAFWSSGSQFDFYKGLAHKELHHSCGPGKTAEHLMARGIQDFLIFPNVEEWRKWVKQVTLQK